MCRVAKCCICGDIKEKCGMACHSDICQMYIKIYALHYHKDGRRETFSSGMYQIAGGTM